MQILSGSPGPDKKAEVLGYDVCRRTWDSSISETYPHDTSTQSEVQIMPPENTFTDISPSSNPAAEAKITNTPTESLSPLIKPKNQTGAVLAATEAFQCGEDEVNLGKGPVLKAQRSEVCDPLEKTESVFEDACKVASAVEAGSIVHEEMLRIEEIAHQQTREEVARLGGWCKHLEAENMELQT